MHLLYPTGFSSQMDSCAFVKITAPNFFSKKMKFHSYVYGNFDETKNSGLRNSRILVLLNKDKISELRNSEYLFSFKNVKLLKISYGVTI